MEKLEKALNNTKNVKHKKKIKNIKNKKKIENIKFDYQKNIGRGLLRLGKTQDLAPDLHDLLIFKNQ